MNPTPNRRQFIQSAAGIAGSLAFPSLVRASPDLPHALEGRLFKTLKIGMVKVEGSLTDKFKAAKAAGFDGIELNAPGIDIEGTRKAIGEAEFPVDGTVCATHWDIRHTSPDDATRAKALSDLQASIRETHAVGGHSVLLVVGKGEDGERQDLWDRSVENISKAIPLAAQLGIPILVENVWNQFLYDHDGGADQTADELARYIDIFDSPWIGVQFDIGNHWKYGSMGDWIRTLDHRILKLDVKGFSREHDKFTAIGEGDIDWPDVRKALIEINYYGWVAAEVGGGDQAELTVIAQQMDAAFGLAPG
ncbi:sugar phosphate isomerase/epimerase [soil metagenome]